MTLQSRKQVALAVAYKGDATQLKACQSWQTMQDEANKTSEMEKEQEALDKWCKQNFCHFFPKGKCKFATGGGKCRIVHYRGRITLGDIEHVRKMSLNLA